MSEFRVIALFYINYVNDGDACLTSHYSIISLRVAFSRKRQRLEGWPRVYSLANL